ncbi:MAG: metal-dependent hydrolase [Phormidesmis sp.]
MAWVPDIDHVVPALQMSQNAGMRISHALASSVVLPVLTSTALYAFGLRGQRWQISSLQSLATGLSHPLMDWFVGVIGLPLFWPFYSTIFKAPVGLLPSAGTPHWQNYYFYANLFIELGILVPLMLVLLRNLSWRTHRLKRWQTAVLTAIALYFLNMSIHLTR